jgi:hypothetical protein
VKITSIGSGIESSFTKSRLLLDQPIEQPDHRGANNASSAARRRGEGAAHQLAQPVVSRRIEKIIMGRASNSRGSRSSAPSAELYVDQSSDASRTSWNATAPRIEGVVAVDRRVIAQPAIERIRILVELVTERIQLHGVRRMSARTPCRSSPTRVRARVA